MLDWLPRTPKASSDALLSLREDLAAFRAAIRAWIGERLPSDWLDRLRGADHETYVAFQKWWFAELSRVGLATPHWPAEAAGVELPLSGQIVIYEELARAHAPSPTLYAFSIYHVPATLLHAGTEEQRATYLPGVQERGDVWCQGFSEPNAGSDLASLRTRAEKVEGGYRVNGQKIWSSNGADADFCLLLARTDPAAPKHKGISYFILDMRSEGVDVRPIGQANGESEFNEIFLDDVFIPDVGLIGKEGEGWGIAQATLAAERGIIIFELVERLRLAMDAMLHKGVTEEPGWWRNDASRQQFLTLYSEMRGIQRLIRQGMESEGDPLVASLVKVAYGELLQRYTDWVVRSGGLAAQVAEPLALGTGRHGEMPMPDYLSSYIWTISGGTNEVLRNIIAERGLGLPRDPVKTA